MQFEKVIKIHILKVRIQKHKVKFKIVKEKENLKSFNTNKNIYKQKQGEKKYPRYAWENNQTSIKPLRKKINFKIILIYYLIMPIDAKLIVNKIN